MEVLMNTVETRIRTTSTHPAIDARFAAAARLAREATLRHTAAQACRAVVDALSAPALEYEGIALCLETASDTSAYQVIAGNWPPAPTVDRSEMMRVPMLLDDAQIGELTVYRVHGFPFGEADAALITAAAAHASLAVARAKLVEELELLRQERRDERTELRGRTARRAASPRLQKNRAGAKRAAKNRAAKKGAVKKRTARKRTPKKRSRR